MNNNRWLQVLIILLVIIAATYLLSQFWQLISQFSGILGLFFAAWLLAFILSPIARALAARGLSYGLAVGVVYLALLLLLGGVALLVFPTLAVQIEDLLRNLNTYMAQLEQLSNDTEALLRSWGVRVEDLEISSIYGTMAAQIQNFGVSMLGVVTGVAAFLLNTILVLLISFYMMKDGESMMKNAFRVLPANLVDEAQLLADSIARSFGGFIRGQVVFGVMYGLCNAIIMIVFGLDYVLIASIVTGFCMLIPLVGNFLAYFPPMFILLVNPNTADRWWILLIILFVIQSIMMQVIGPRIMSQAVGMHPLFVVGSMLAGAQVAGVWGAVFGIPVAGVADLVAQPFLSRIMNFFNAPGPDDYTPFTEMASAALPSGAPKLPSVAPMPAPGAAPIVGEDDKPTVETPIGTPVGGIRTPIADRLPRVPAVVRGLAALAATARRKR